MTGPSDLNLFTYEAPLPDPDTDPGEGVLAGIRLAVKDNIAVREMPLTCASHILEDFIAPYEATAVERLRAEGVRIVGKTNMDEFAMGSSSEFSIFGAVHNPVAIRCVCGAASGGSAPAVAADMAESALGSDTGGSVRQPAAFCGVMGMKPTYGRVSRYGLVAFASSLDQIGIFSRDIRTNARVLEIIAGQDSRDATSQPGSIPEYANHLDADPDRQIIGIPAEYYAQGLDPDIAVRLQELRARLQESGFRTREVSLPQTPHAVAMYYIIASAEASSNLARYDGVRYGSRSRSAELEEMYVETRGEGFGPEVKRRIMLGTYVLSAGYYDAYYGRAQKVRRLLSDDFARVFQEVDLLLTPTTPTTAFPLGSKLDDPLAMYLNDIYTTSVNLAGLPALSIPVGVDRLGLPIGCQLIAAPFREETIYQVGTIIERFGWE